MAFDLHRWNYSALFHFVQPFANKLKNQCNAMASVIFTAILQSMGLNFFPEPFMTRSEVIETIMKNQSGKKRMKERESAIRNIRR
jgi:hypothetical protein